MRGEGAGDKPRRLDSQGKVIGRLQLRWLIKKVMKLVSRALNLLNFQEVLDNIDSVWTGSHFWSHIESSDEESE